MSKDYQLVVNTTNNGEYLFWCSGCGEVHAIQTMDNKFGALHNFNNNLFKPTFNLKSGAPFSCSDNNHRICHFTITDGIIKYCTECTHHLRGLSVKMRYYKDWGGITFYGNKNNYKIEY